MTAAQRPGVSGASTDSGSQSPQSHGSGPRAAHRVRVLLYSDDVTTREAVRLAVGRRPSRDVEVESWHECATADAVLLAAGTGDHDLLVLDGEATPYGGLGLCRELKHTVYECPPVIVLTGRPQDAWLASWSYADHAVPHPIDPLAMADAVARLARGRVAGSGSASPVR